jgi:dGTPase
MMDWSQLLSTARIDQEGKWAPQLSGDERSQWQRDHDRLIFSGAFRRLAVKTQVHSLSDNDHVHTRLSHSLEVASVGRSLGARLGHWMRDEGLLCETYSGSGVGALVQSACLAHDIGNPPFGHAGERAIRQFFEAHPEYLTGLSYAERSDLTGFEGNAQGFRLITCLERHWLDGGMRLTAATLGSFIKYPFAADSTPGRIKQKHGVNQAELPFMRVLASHLGLIDVMPDVWARHPLVYVVEAADDICYALIDLEDAVELGHLDYEEVSSLMKELVDRGARRNLYEQLLDDSEAKLELLRSAAIDALVHEAEARFQSHYDAIISGTFDEELLDWRRASAGEVIERAKNLAQERVYVDLTKQSCEGQGGRLLDTLLSHLIDGVEALANAGGDWTDISPKARDAVERLGKYRPRPNDSKYQRLLRVTDYVSAMTDRYLTRLVDDLVRLGYFDSAS